MTDEADPDNVSKDAAQIATGGSIVFAAGLVDRALRLVVTWLLSGALGVAVFGSYTFAVTVVSVVTVFSPLGLDFGAVFFGAQHKKNKKEAKRKGLVISGASLCLVSGIVTATLLWCLAPILFENPVPIQLIAPAILFWTPLLFVVGLLRSVKDMRGNALSLQLSLPFCMCIGAILVTFLDLSIEWAIGFFCTSLLVALVVGIIQAWKHFSPMLRNKGLKAEYETGKILRYSFPQGLAAMVFRLNVWMDILMMGYLSEPSEIGLYKIAASIALIAGLPINALTTIFNPFISELVGSNQLKKLNELLKITTRWLLTISLPVIMVLMLLPDVILGLFDEEYGQSKIPLQILLGGQVVWVACALAMRLIPMSGHTTLNLINGIVAAVLNFALNFWLIPLYGSIGAAAATSITLAAWSLWRLIEIWWLLKCFPFSKSSFILLLYSIGGTTGLHFLLMDQGLPYRIIGVCVFIFVFFLIAYTVPREEADEVIGNKIRKVARRFRRRK
jgi:O-antigen/teichoic acid export membrane protein